MKNMTRLLFFLAISFLFVWACDEIDDPAAEGSPPMLKVDFVPLKSKDSVSARYTELGQIRTTLNDELDSMREKGGNAEDSIAIKEQLSEVDTLLSKLGPVNDQFKKNQVTLHYFEAIGGGILEKDTTNSVFVLPLNINSDSSAFVFGYYQFYDTIVFRYQTKISSSLDRISVIANNLSVPYSSFDSLSRHFCEGENCTSGEITYKVYF